MTQRAIRLVKQCLALAASTTHEGEREAALSRANELCFKYELDPAQFVLPEISVAAGQEPEPDAPVYDAAFWADWESYWRDQKRNQRYGGKSPEELMVDPSWLEAMAQAARDHTNSYFGEPA